MGMTSLLLLFSQMPWCHILGQHALNPITSLPFLSSQYCLMQIPYPFHLSVFSSANNDSSTSLLPDVGERMLSNTYHIAWKAGTWEATNKW
jgi:hypothetical protein